MAAEARDIVRRAVGDAAGLTIKGQVRRATENLGFPPESWRPREAFYGRAGGWSAAALDDLRARFAAWRDREAGRSDPDALVQRIEALRATLAMLARQINELAAELTSGSI